MKKILILGNYPPPYGGVPNHIRNLANYLAESNFEISVISGGIGGEIKIKDNLKIYKLSRIEKIINCFKSLRRLGGLPINLSLLLKAPQHCFRYMYLSEYIEKKISMDGKFDIVLCYNIVLFGPVAQELNKKYGTKYIISIFGELYNPNNKGFIHNSLFIESAKKASCFISCSKHCGDSLRFLGAYKANIIQYGIDVNSFRLYSQEDILIAKKNYNIPDDKIIIGFIGRFSEELGFDDIQIFANQLLSERSDVELLLAGNPEKNIKKAENLKRKFGNRVHVFANPNFNMLSDLINVLDISLVPSKGERTCSSLAAMESLLCGVETIAYDTGGIYEILSSTFGATLISEGSKEEFMELMNKKINENTHKDYYKKIKISKAALKFDQINTNKKYRDIVESNL
jgi:glycosyltransferase involved in cell wall biosynthesis